MERSRLLERSRVMALKEALLASCPRQRNLHEEQARAYAKIIDVLSREGKQAIAGARPR